MLKRDRERRRGGEAGGEGVDKEMLNYFIANWHTRGLSVSR